MHRAPWYAAGVRISAVRGHRFGTSTAMEHNPWIERESAIRTQLGLQVELSFGRHHRFMLEHGLGECSHVVDVGTGSGLFLERLARQHPTLRFTGLDDKPHMVAEASARKQPNVDWIRADALDGRTREVLGAADGILMRYFVLHMHDTAVTLPRILQSARPGTRLWIFDLDTDYCACEPEEEAFTAFQDLVNSFCGKNGVEIRTGSRLPPVLEAAGFQVDEVAVEPFDNQEIEPDLFSEYLLREAALYQYFLEGTPTSAKTRQIEEFLSHGLRRETHYVRYGMVMLGATKIQAVSASSCPVPACVLRGRGWA